MAWLLQSRRSLLLLAACLLAAVGLVPAGAAVGALPTPVPTVSDYQFLSSSTTPPTQAECNSAIPVARRCFTPTSMRNSYNVTPLIANGMDGRGQTIAIIDSFGNPNMASDLKVFNDAMGTSHMCGEPGASCAAGTPTFQHVYWNGTTMVKEPPSGAQNPGLQTRNIWALEVALDVEWAHAIAPGTANASFTPVPTQPVFPFPTVEWPASDPLVTGVGGTYLCTDALTGTHVDNTSPPVDCQNQPNREKGWIASGGGFSHVFGKPAFQNTLPAGSTAIPTRGVPDIAYQASARTGVLVYDTAPGDAEGGVVCPSGNPCSAGWYVVGGTSSGCPQWAALVAIADQIAGHGLGMINPALYALAKGPNYGTYFYDVTTGNNQANPAVMGYPATTGWDPVTGLGTPNAANLLPALAGS